MKFFCILKKPWFVLWIPAFFLGVFLLSGCRKFLNQRPSTNTINPATLNDLREMLDHDSLVLCDFMLADIMSDDIKMDQGTLERDTASYYRRSYFWLRDIWNAADPDFMYNSAYRRILQMNIVLSKIEAMEGALQQKNAVRAQAQINRAWYYLQLVNLYGADYRAATAATDLAVPLILSPDAVLQPARASVQAVYNQVLQDLNAAVASADLPAMGQTIVQPGKAAGYALLARTYLYMGNYQEAETAATAAMAIKNDLLNYNQNYVPPTIPLDLSRNPEILLGRLCNDRIFASKYGRMAFMCNDFLYALFTENDTRLILNFNVSSNSASYSVNGGNFTYLSFNYSMGVPEVLLTKAECLARRGDAAGALELVNRLRQHRLIQYTPIEDATNVLATVLQERRRELFYHGGLRLFDLKRLNRDHRFAQTLQRIANDGISTTVLATLAPNAPRYLMQFSPLIIANNPNMIQNPR